jgi:hypothetical protein
MKHERRFFSALECRSCADFPCADRPDAGRLQYSPVRDFVSLDAPRPGDAESSSAGNR